MWQYILCMVISAVVCVSMYMGKLKAYSGAKPSGSIVTAVASLLLCLVGGKLFYVLFQLDFAHITSLNPEHFSIFGGALGVCLGVALCARLCYVRPMDALNAFAPGGAVLLCGARLGEFFLGPDYLKHGMIGLSDSLELLFDGNYWHVCLAEAAVALTAALLAWWIYDRRICFLRTVWFVCAFQLLTELFHNQSLIMSFVKEEQVACAVVMAVILFVHCRHGLSHDDHQRFTPFLWFFAPVAIIGYLEFELDKAWFDNFMYENVFSRISMDLADAVTNVRDLICFGCVLLCIVWACVLQIKAIRRRADLMR